MKHFLDEYRKVANDTSGVIALAAFQSLVMAASFRQFDTPGGREHPILFSVFLLISAIGLITSAFSVGRAIIHNETVGKWERLIMLMIFEIVYIGIVLSAGIAIKSW